MTHSLYWIIEFSSKEDMLGFKKELLSKGNELCNYYCLKNTEYGIENVNGYPPNIYFANEEDEDKHTWNVSVETGSHTSKEDTGDAMFWFWFCFMAKDYLGCENNYFNFEGDDTKVSWNKMFNSILRCCNLRKEKGEIK